MARWKEAASQGRREEVIDRVHWLWSLPAVPIDLDPGPSLQWYPERWESDPDVQVMPWAVKAMHLHLIHVAFKDSRPSGSIATAEEMRIQCGDPEDDEWQRIWRTLSRAWVERHDRMWQPGTCRCYLGALVGRIRRAKAAAARWKNDAEIAKQERGEAMHLQCIALEDALQGVEGAMHVAEDTMQPLPSPSPSPSPTPTPTPLRIQEEEEAALAAGDNGRPDLNYPTELLQMVPDFQHRWEESRRKRRLSKKLSLEVEQDQIDELLAWGNRYGTQAILDGLKAANGGGWQSLSLKAPRGRDNREVEKIMAPAEPMNEPDIDLPGRLESLAASLPAKLHRREALARRIRALKGDAEKIERDLEVIDREIVQRARKALPGSEAEVIDEELAPSFAALVKRLPAAELERAKDGLREQMLRRRFKLPELSLFSPEATA